MLQTGSLSLLPRKQSTATEVGGQGTLGGPGPSPDELEPGRNFPHSCWAFPQLRIPKGVGSLLSAKHNRMDNGHFLDPH